MPRRTVDPPGRLRKARYLFETAAFDLVSAFALRMSARARQRVAHALGYPEQWWWMPARLAA